MSCAARRAPRPLSRNTPGAKSKRRGLPSAYGLIPMLDGAPRIAISRSIDLLLITSKRQLDGHKTMITKRNTTCQTKFEGDTLLGGDCNASASLQTPWWASSPGLRQHRPRLDGGQAVRLSV